MSNQYNDALYETLYEKHLEKMLALHKDVDKAELEAETLTEKEMEKDEYDNFVDVLESDITNGVMEKTYQILLTLNVPSGLDGEPYITIKDIIYSHLKELIEDDTLYFTEME